MRERPILFSAPMVRAILAGTKTQTRRIANLDKLRVRLPGTVMSDPWPGQCAEIVARPGKYRARLNPQGAVSIQVGEQWLGVKPGEFHFVCPYADGDTHLGDYGNGRKVWTITPSASRLWVREAFALAPACSDPDPDYEDDWHVVYRATEDDPDVKWIDADGKAVSPWKPSIYMPRWASRLTLEVTGVRVERLQAISKDDAVAEGARFTDYGQHESQLSADGGKTWGTCRHQRAGWSLVETTSHKQCLGSPQMAFANLWIAINGRESWDANPWVWVVEFKRVEAQERAA